MRLARRYSGTISRRKMVIALWVTLLGTIFSGCGSGTRRAVQLGERATGMTVSQIITEFGVPTVDRQVVVAMPSSDLCARDPNHVRALEYHIPDRGVVRTAMKTLGFRELSAMTLLCVDKADTVRVVHKIEF